MRTSWRGYRLNANTVKNIIDAEIGRSRKFGDDRATPSISSASRTPSRRREIAGSRDVLAAVVH